MEYILCLATAWALDCYEENIWKKKVGMPHKDVQVRKADNGLANIAKSDPAPGLDRAAEKSCATSKPARRILTLPFTTN